MSDFVNKMRQEFTGFLPEMQQRFRDERASEIQSACDDERENNIARAALAMIDAGLDDSVVEHMLQKHWDLRLSETKPFLEWAHKQLNKSNRTQN